MNSASNKNKNLLLGIGLIVLAGLLLAIHDATTKHLVVTHSLALILWARYAMQSILLPLLFCPRMGKQFLRTRHPWLQLVRGLCLIGVSVFLLGGLRFIPLAEAVAVIFLAPTLVTLFSVLLLNERISRVQWVSVALGLLGVVLVVRPGTALFDWPVLLPIAAAVCFALYQLVTRMLAEDDNVITSNFYSGVVGALLLTPFGLPYLDSLPTLSPLALTLLLSLGAIAMTGHILLTMAYRYASAAALAPYTYAQIISAGLVGWIVFGHLPDLLALAGMSIITFGGVLLGWQQMHR